MRARNWDFCVVTGSMAVLNMVSLIVSHHREAKPAYQAFSSTGNWAVFLHLHDKIEDFVKPPFFNEKSY